MIYFGKYKSKMDFHRKKSGCGNIRVVLSVASSTDKHVESVLLDIFTQHLYKESIFKI